MAAKPCRTCQIEHQFAFHNRAMIAFTNETESQSSSSRRPALEFLGACIRRCSNREANCVPVSRRGRPRATAGIAKIAEGLQDVLEWNFAIVSRSRAVAAPSAAKREPCGMLPSATLQFFDGHEIRAGQRSFSWSADLLGLAIVASWAMSRHPRGI